jgi:hypothetical protein
MAAADANDEAALRRSHHQQQDPILRRRKQSCLHLGSSAIARVGVPQAEEVRQALEASRALGAMRRSRSDLSLSERRLYQFWANMPYDSQRHADDQAINRLLMEWTPEWDGIPRGEDDVDIGPKQEISMASEEEPRDVEAEDDMSELPVFDDDFEFFSEHSSTGVHAFKAHAHAEFPGAELQRDDPAQPAEQQPGAPLSQVGNTQPGDITTLALGNDSTSEIERLENESSMLRFKRNVKRTHQVPLPQRFEEKEQHRSGNRVIAGAVESAIDPNPQVSDQNCSGTKAPSVPEKPATQPRETTDEVQDETDTKTLPQNQQQTKVRDANQVGNNRPENAPMSAMPGIEATGADLQWAQRALLDDSTALLETTTTSTTDPARGDTVSGSQTRREFRAATRREEEAAKRKGTERGRLRKTAPDMKVQEQRQRQSSRVRLPGGFRR